MNKAVDRFTAPAILVYWHCQSWWSLDEGPVCPMEHDTPIYDDRPRKGRKRKVWICEKNGAAVAYLSHKAFMEHDEENCYADV